ncbi:MAG: hypothetical protein LBH14_08120 [Desulfobulbaceae bacterium]|jgi:hypothetical protein|nr:hypothetical protein [Desulfobulbaceae bacterium]
MTVGGGRPAKSVAAALPAAPSSRHPIGKDVPPLEIGGGEIAMNIND